MEFNKQKPNVFPPTETWEAKGQMMMHAQTYGLFKSTSVKLTDKETSPFVFQMFDF